MQNFFLNFHQIKGYSAFVKDSFSLVESNHLVKTKTKREIINPFLLFNQDTEAYLNYSFDYRYKTIPKGKSIKGKTNYILNKLTASTHKKGIKISEYPESNIKTDTKMIIKSIINERPKKGTTKKLKVAKLSDLVKVDQFKIDDNNNNDQQNIQNQSDNQPSFELDKEKLNEYANRNGIKINQMLTEENSNYKKVKLKVSQKDFEYWNKFLREGDDKKNKKYIQFVSKILKSYDIDKKFLVNINNFPLVLEESLDTDQKALYTQQELDLFNNYLFKKSIDSDHSISLPSVTKILEIVKSEQSYKNLLQYKIENICTLGLDGFLKKQQMIKDSGTQFHKYIEEKLDKKENIQNPIGIEPEKLYMLEKILQTDIGNVLFKEKKVKHEKLFYQGNIGLIKLN
jgi:hypothetical protein